jgi:cell wall-associated NlpC family hydrolase
MKHLIPFACLLLALPQAAHAQLDIILGETGPEVRASVAGVILSAGLGASGVDVRVAERRTTTARTTTRPRTTSPTRRTTTPTTTRPRSTGTTAGTRATAAGVLATADNYVGTKYVWGGTTPRGFDCSGFVQYVFRRQGIELPRTSRQQAQVGQSVPLSRLGLRTGDLLFFATNGVRVDHIAIYAGDNQIIHSSSSGGGVGYDNLGSKRGRWFADHHVATRRVLAGGRSLVAPLTAALRAFAELDPPDRAPTDLLSPRTYGRSPHGATR